MNIGKILVSLALAMALLLAGMSAFAQQQPKGMPFHHGWPRMMGQSAISGDQQHLYILACGQIIQYSLADLKLVKTVDLPKPEPPADFKAKGKDESGKFPPPPPFPMGGPQGLWVGKDALYVLAGPLVFQYSTPDLTLKTKAQLPKPEFSQVGK